MTKKELRDLDPHAAVESLRAALTENGIGRVRADVAERLTRALQHGGRE